MLTEEEYKQYDTLLHETRFDVNEIMDTKKRFKQVYDLLYKYMQMGFEEERVRKHTLYYAFSKHPEEVFEMQVRHFLVNMLFWLPMTRIGIPDKIDKTYVLDCSCLNKKQMMGYFNDKVIVPYRDLVSNEEMNQIFADTIYRLSLISLDFNEIMAISINIQTFIGMAERYPEFDDCIHTKVDPSMQPKEIENLQHARMHQLINMLKEHENDIQPILNSGEGIKDKQLSEFAVIGGLKPDMVGNTIPKPIDTNFIVGGLNSVSNFFIDKQAGRKAVVANKTLMGNAGYFAAKIMKITKDTRLDMNVEDCGTHHPILYHVKDRKHLNTIDHSFYYLPDDPSETLRVASKKDEWLIGKDIYLRSPVTCGLGHNYVCKHCYGEMYKVNGDPDFGQGGFASAISANKYQQDTLSTKHLMTTNSVPIKFPDIFYEVFDLEANIISINPEKIEEPKRWSVIIDEERMVEYDQVEFNSHTSQLILKDNKTKEEYVIEEENGSEIFLYQDIIKKFREAKKQIVLDVGKLDDTINLGLIVVENNELTKPLKHMQKLLDTNDHLGCQTVDELVNKMADLMIEANMGVLLVHGCMTLKNLVRKADNIYEYPNFASFAPQTYQILKITDALVNNPSLTTGLASQDLRKQFSDPATYRKCAKASTDVYFRKSLYDVNHHD